MGFGSRSGWCDVRRALVVVVAVAGLALPASAAASLGELTQKAGTAGCISETGSGGACADGMALNNATSVTVSPDGKSAYATGSNSAAVVVFDRAADGALTQKAGTAGCISGFGGLCADGRALASATSVAVSPDGKSAYVASVGDDSVAVFDRAADGTLTQKGGPAGCTSDSGHLGLCVDGFTLDFAISVTVSPDGKSVYVASAISDGVAVFDRAADGTITQTGSLTGPGMDDANSVTVSPDGTSVYVVGAASDAVAVLDRAANGTLTQKAGTDGCVDEVGTVFCADGEALDQASGVTVSPDGKSVYVASQGSGAVAVFDRAANGTLTQKAGAAGCISETGNGGACADGKALVTANSVTVAPDGASVYVTSPTSGAVAVFDRAANGTLTQKAGTPGCISETGSSGTCADGKALDAVVSVTVSPDGTSVYTGAETSDAVAVFDRERPPADLSMSLQGRPSPLSVGSQLTYKLRMRNAGPGTATGVTAVLLLSPSETFVSSTSACFLVFAGVVNCVIPRAIAPGAGATPSVTVTVNQVGLIETAATVFATSSDPVAANNSSTERTRVVP
jgi:uncharacterized repeat protein (TIGR01451 family)